MEERNQKMRGWDIPEETDDAPTLVASDVDDDAPTVCVGASYSFEDAPTCFGGDLSLEDAPTFRSDDPPTESTAPVTPQGETLKDLLARYPQGLLRSEAITIVYEIARQLEGKVHGNVSPETVLLGSNDEVALIDGGVRPRGSNYAAPEFIRGHFAGDACSDVFSLGVLFHELLTGRLPYRNPEAKTFEARWMSPSPIRIRTGWRNLFSGVNGILRRAVVLDRARRYQTMADFLAALGKIRPTRAW